MRKLAYLAVGVVFLAHAAGAAVYDEAIDGDLSDNRLAPTSLGTLANGVSSILGSSASAGRDYVTFTIPAGGTLAAITLASFASTDDLGFMAIQAGATFTEPASGTNVGNLLGYAHFGPGPGGAPVGSNTLIPMSTAAGAIGFDVPLGTGPYTLWLQQTNPQLVTYRFDITVVPEPGTMALLALGLVGLLAAVRRRA